MDKKKTYIAQVLTCIIDSLTGRLENSGVQLLGFFGIIPGISENIQLINYLFSLFGVGGINQGVGYDIMEPSPR